MPCHSRDEGIKNEEEREGQIREIKWQWSPLSKDSSHTTTVQTSGTSAVIGREGYHATWRKDRPGHRRPAAGNADEGGRERERKLIFINLPLSEERSGKEGGRERAAAASAASKFDCFSDGGTDERTSEGANNQPRNDAGNNAPNISNMCPLPLRRRGGLPV